MCDSVTKRPLPASVVAERCNSCRHPICGWCKNKMRNGAACLYYLDRIGIEEEAFQHLQRRTG
jgi:hypothetical protein